MRKNFGTKSWFYPLPVLVIGTYDENGNPDAMNAAWGGLYDADKVVLCLSAGHKTTRNIQAKGAFTVSFADAAKRRQRARGTPQAGHQRRQLYRGQPAGREQIARF